jgi:hypothetical protein
VSGSLLGWSVVRPPNAVLFFLPPITLSSISGVIGLDWREVWAKMRRASAGSSHSPLRFSTPRSAQVYILCLLTDCIIAGVETSLTYSKDGGISFAGTFDQNDADRLKEVWIAMRRDLRAVLERVILLALVEGRLPAVVKELTRDPEARVHH